jgi:hypothetical protein
MLGAMNGRIQQMPKAELTRVLERADLPDDLIEEVTGELPDLVDFDRDAAVLDRYGLTRDRLVDMMGGSP